MQKPVKQLKYRFWLQKAVKKLMMIFFLNLHMWFIYWFHARFYDPLLWNDIRRLVWFSSLFYAHMQKPVKKQKIQFLVTKRGENCLECNIFHYFHRYLWKTIIHNNRYQQTLITVQKTFMARFRVLMLFWRNFN